MEVKGKGQMDVFHLESAIDLGSFTPTLDGGGEEGVEGCQSRQWDAAWGCMPSSASVVSSTPPYTRVAPLKTLGAREVCGGSVGVDRV